MKNILTSSEMKKVDTETIERIGIPGIVLMERAALSVASLIMENEPVTKTVQVIAGVGNNGVCCPLDYEPGNRGTGSPGAYLWRLAGVGIPGRHSGGTETAPKGEPAGLPGNRPRGHGRRRGHLRVLPEFRL